MSEAEQLVQSQTAPMETEPTTADAAAEASGSESPATVVMEETNGNVSAAEEAKEEAKEEQKKEEVLVLGLDYGTQKCVLAVSRSAEMFPEIIRNNLANPVTPYVPKLFLIILLYFILFY